METDPLALTWAVSLTATGRSFAGRTAMVKVCTGAVSRPVIRSTKSRLPPGEAMIPWPL